MTGPRSALDDLTGEIKWWLSLPCGEETSRFRKLHKRPEHEHLTAEAAGLADHLIRCGWRLDRPAHVGTLTAAQLADLDPHDRQAMEATEQ